MKIKPPAGSFTIEKDVPVPESKGHLGNGHDTRYPFAKMKIGNSFFVPKMTSTAFYANTGGFRKRNPDFKITVKRWNEDGVPGIRVWRIKKVVTT